MNLSRLDGRALVAGFALGAGAAYFFDPDRGEIRRRRVAREARALLDEAAAALGATRHRGRDERPTVPDGLPRRRNDLPGVGGAELRAMPYDEGPPGALLGLAGGVLTAYGLTRRDRLATAMAALGAGMVAGGVVQNPALGVRDRRRAIEVQRTFQLEASPDAVFEWWSRPARLARFLSYVDEVRDLGGGRVEWRVQGPGDEPLVWRATVTALEPGRLLAWRSDADALVSQSATVRVTPTEGGAQLDLRIAYAPPAGHEEPDVTTLLGWDPRYTIDQDLERFAQLLSQRGASPDPAEE
jgi:uncharacterized membrane protein